MIFITLREPNATKLVKEGYGFIADSIGLYSGVVPYTAFNAKKSYIEKNPDIIQNFTNAIYEGQQWVKEHTSKEIAESVQSFFPDTDLEMLETAIQSYKDIDAWNDTPVLTKESFEKLEDVMIEAGELLNKVPYEELVNNTYAEKAIENK